MKLETVKFAQHVNDFNDSGYSITEQTLKNLVNGAIGNENVLKLENEWTKDKNEETGVNLYIGIQEYMEYEMNLTDEQIDELHDILSNICDDLTEYSGE